MDKNEHSQLEEGIRANSVTNDVSYLWVDFSRPFSMDFLKISENKSTGLDQTHTTASLLLLPETANSTGELDESCASNLQAHQKHSICFWSEKATFRVLDQLIDNYQTTTKAFKNATLNDRKDAAKIKCTRPLRLEPVSTDFDTLGIIMGLKIFGGKLGCVQSKFDLSPPNPNFAKTVNILINPKERTFFVHRMIVMLKDANYVSKMAISQFVIYGLNNPGAHLVAIEGEAAVFEQSNAFSTETMRFIDESCRSNEWKHDEFSLADVQQVKRILKCSKKMAFFWNGSSCPIQTGIYNKACPKTRYDHF